jgi:hypothetical protein
VDSAIRTAETQGRGVLPYAPIPREVNMMIREHRGGKRRGAGRKPKTFKGGYYRIYLRAEMVDKVREYIAQLRKDLIEARKNACQVVPELLPDE